MTRSDTHASSWRPHVRAQAAGKPSGTSYHGQLPSESVTSIFWTAYPVLQLAMSKTDMFFISLSVTFSILRLLAVIAWNYLFLAGAAKEIMLERVLGSAGGPKGNLPPRGVCGKDDERVQILEHRCAGLGARQAPGPSFRACMPFLRNGSVAFGATHTCHPLHRILIRRLLNLVCCQGMHAYGRKLLSEPCCMPKVSTYWKTYIAPFCLSMEDH